MFLQYSFWKITLATFVRFQKYVWTFCCVGTILIFSNYFYNFLSAPPPTEIPSNPCNPSPCGSNAVCKERNDAGSCSCLPEYFGDPYIGCRPECVTNSDCDRSRACVNNKCVDPCPGSCGINAECAVFNHAPSCSCIVGYTGDPSVRCLLIEPSKKL